MTFILWSVSYSNRCISSYIELSTLSLGCLFKSIGQTYETGNNNKVSSNLESYDYLASHCKWSRLTLKAPKSSLLRRAYSV